MENKMQELLGWMEAVYGAAAHTNWSGVCRAMSDFSDNEAMTIVSNMIDNLHARAELMDLR
jgi:hypothetical protein